MKKKENPEKLEIGLKYKALRVKKRLRQQDVADELKVSQKLISYVESGEKQSPRVMRLLQEFFSE